MKLKKHFVFCTLPSAMKRLSVWGMTIALLLTLLPTGVLAIQEDVVSGGDRERQVLLNELLSPKTSATPTTTDTPTTPVSSSVNQTLYYNVAFDTDGGSFVKSQRIRKYKTVTVPETPEKEGFVFDGWYTDKTYSTPYDFEKRVTDGFMLYAKWKETEEEPRENSEKEQENGQEQEIQEEQEQTQGNVHDCPSAPFDDLDTTLWYHAGTDFVIGKNLMHGMAAKLFAPDASLTRAMLVTVLYRNEGEPATNRSIPFADTDMGAYYGSAVIWAKQNEIIMGISETLFAPDAHITREEIATILYRYAQYKDMNAVTLEENLHFEDAEEISEYAVSAMNWAVGQGLIEGRGENMLYPKENATRAEIAAILRRFIGKNE